MQNKETILDNVSDYSADQLVKFINKGIVTYSELCNDTDGQFSASLRHEVERKLESMQNTEDDLWNDTLQANTIPAFSNYLSSYPNGEHVNEAMQHIAALSQGAASPDDGMVPPPVPTDVWETVDQNNIEDLRQFVRNNPGNPHVQEARKLINKLSIESIDTFDPEYLAKKVKNIETDQSVINKDNEIFDTITSYLNRGKITTNDIIEMLREDHNIFSATVVQNLLEEGFLEYGDLMSVGIDQDFLRNLANDVRTRSFPAPEPLEKINKVSTEVYFWGIPSSGKSCALGAILSVAGNGLVARSMSQDPDCQGYGYMRRLAALFNEDGQVSTLPPSTSIFSTYEMGFDLEDQEGKIHPITCVDLAGELVRIMYKSDANEPLNDDENDALDTLTRVLIDNRSTNQKMHFFVIEYNADDRLYEGLPQNVYLDSALRYIQRTGIFKNDTDAIYIMITKVDKVNPQQGSVKDVLRDYISSKYLGFYNGLEKICRDYEINNGRVEVIPFSLGEICFQTYCRFNDRRASAVVRKLLERTKGMKNGKLQRRLNWFKK